MKQTDHVGINIPEDTGSGTPFNVMPPYVVMSYIIRAV